MNIISIALFLGGILIMGSDGQWFPYVNITGTVSMLAGVCLINKYN